MWYWQSVSQRRREFRTCPFHSVHQSFYIGPAVLPSSNGGRAISRIGLWTLWLSPHEAPRRGADLPVLEAEEGTTGPINFQIQTLRQKAPASPRYNRSIPNSGILRFFYRYRRELGGTSYAGKLYGGGSGAAGDHYRGGGPPPGPGDDGRAGPGDRHGAAPPPDGGSGRRDLYGQLGDRGAAAGPPAGGAFGRDHDGAARAGSGGQGPAGRRAGPADEI